MSPLQWDRMLETCYRQDATDLLFVPGPPPMVRLRTSWRALELPPVDAAAVQALANERIGAEPDGRADGYAYSDFSYGDVIRFRAMAFGYPFTDVLVIARRPTEPDDESS